jgi:Flp pilus assembly protein TadG
MFGDPTLACRKFVSDRSGVAALEFALVGPVLLLLVVMILENGLMLFAQAVLDNATTTAARQIQIGAVKTSAAFRSAVCANMSTFLNCANLQFYVASSSSAFPAGATPSSNGSFATSSFTTGSGGNYVLVEVAYDRAYVAPWLISLDPSGWVLLSTQAFQNEPFS